jgi:hypothetical protein
VDVQLVETLCIFQRPYPFMTREPWSPPLIQVRLSNMDIGSVC